MSYLLSGKKRLLMLSSRVNNIGVILSSYGYSIMWKSIKLHVAKMISVLVKGVYLYNTSLGKLLLLIFACMLECYLQVKNPNGQSSCPFCSSPMLAAKYTPKPSANTIQSSSPYITPTKNQDGTDSPLSVTPSPPIPISQTPPSTTASVSSSPPIVASIAERQQLEQAMQSQRNSADFETPLSSRNSRSRSHSLSGDYRSIRSSRSNSSRQREYSRSSMRRQRRHNNEPDYEDDSYQEGYDMNFNLEQVEEMMLLEAIRLSMLETSTEEVSNSLPPPPPPQDERSRICPCDSVPYKDEMNGEGIEREHTLNDSNQNVNSVRNKDCQQHDVNNKVCGEQNESEKVVHEYEDSTNQCEDIDDEEDEYRMLELALSMSLQPSIESTTNEVKILDVEFENNSSSASIVSENSNFQYDISDDVKEDSLKISCLHDEQNKADTTTLSPAAKNLVAKIERALSNGSNKKCDESRSIESDNENICKELFGDNNSDEDGQGQDSTKSMKFEVCDTVNKMSDEYGSSSDDDIEVDAKDIRVIKNV